MRFVYAALLISFLLFGCSKASTEPKEDELLLTPIEDLGFSHDAEADDPPGLKIYSLPHSASLSPNPVKISPKSKADTARSLSHA